MKDRNQNAKRWLQEVDLSARDATIENQGTE